MKVLHTPDPPTLPPHIARGHLGNAISFGTHTKAYCCKTAGRPVMRRSSTWINLLKEMKAKQKCHRNENSLLYRMCCLTRDPAKHTYLQPQQGGGTSFHSPAPHSEANSAKQKPCEIMSMASLSCSFTCRHYRQLFPRSRQTETAQQIVTDRVREMESTPESIPPYRTMKVDAFVAYQNQNWIQKSHQKSIREHTATGSARATWRENGKGEWEWKRR